MPQSSISRRELFDLVWEKPLCHLAKDLNVSGSYLTRVCRDLEINKPPVGYWLRKELGRAEEKPELNPPSADCPASWLPMKMRYVEPALDDPSHPTELSSYQIDTINSVKAFEKRRVQDIREKSRKALLVIVDRWEESKRLHSFLDQLHRESFDVKTGDKLAMRQKIADAREIAGDVSVLTQFDKWQIPDLTEETFAGWTWEDFEYAPDDYM